MAFWSPFDITLGRRPSTSTSVEVNSRTLENALSIILGYDPVTLRERVDLRAVGERMTELGDLRTLSALSEKTVLLRLSGQLDDALYTANEAVRQARFTGDRQEMLAARARRAQVLHYLGKVDEAITELTSCIDEGRLREWRELEAFALHARGLAHFQLGDYLLATADLKAAVFLGDRNGGSPEALGVSLSLVEAAEQRVRAGRLEK